VCRCRGGAFVGPIEVMIDDWRKTISMVTRDQMVEVDRAMIEDFGIELLQMMENAGRHLVQLTRDRFLAGDARGKEVAVLAGIVGNGGGFSVGYRDRARRDHGRNDATDRQSHRHDDARASQSRARGPRRGGVHRAVVPRGYRCPRRRLSANSGSRPILFFSGPICCDSANISTEGAMKTIVP